MSQGEGGEQLTPTELKPTVVDASINSKGLDKLS